MIETQSVAQTTPGRGRKLVRASLLSFMSLAAVALIGAWALYSYFNSPPDSFPENSRVTVAEGETLGEIAESLEQLRVIRSATLLKLAGVFSDIEHMVYAGDYVFTAPLSTIEVLRRITSATDTVPPVKITIPEGSTLAEIEAIVRVALPHIAEGEIVRTHNDTEGGLFPDTYLVKDTATAEEVVSLLRAHYTEKLEPLREAIEQSSFSEHEVIILASILEGEANSEASMRMVSGILQSRLRLGMPLQVDATFLYELGKASHELTADDLAIDSPYNTYLYPGLPPGPIGNPGMMAIEAVLSPLETDYLYYLTGADGAFYYARTFEEHKENKARYLR
jgi:UPF0755 protein